jgi:hypothetical protein
MSSLNIEKIDNGYLIHGYTIKRKADTLQEVFKYMLSHFEGRSEYFGGKSFGNVIVLYEPTKEFPEIDPA